MTLPTLSSEEGEDIYRRPTELEHVHLRPDMFLGPLEPVTVNEMVWENNKFEMATFVQSGGLVQTFREIASNSADAAENAASKQIPFDKIVFHIDSKTIRVGNGGVPIKQGWWTSEKDYYPSVLFGMFRSGTKFEDKQALAGRNGYGASLVTAFSTRFKLNLWNGTSHYSQEWTTHMVKHDPVIVPSTRPPWTEIEYELDLPRFFGMTEYSPNLQKFFMRIAIETAVMSKVPFSINGVNYPILPFEKFCKLFVPNSTPFIYYYDPEFRSDLLLMDTPSNPRVWSAVNAQATIKNGAHVNKVYDLVIDEINKNRNEVRKVELGDVKPYLSIFVSIRAIKAKYGNQAKENYRSPPAKVSLPPNFGEVIKKWELLKKIDAHVDFRIEEQIISETDEKKSMSVRNVPNYDPANWAGGPRAHECWLWYGEGVSAKGYARWLREELPGGVDTNGDLASGGKIPNALNTPFEELIKNNHIDWLRKVLGLRERVDYTIEENFRTLNYGHLVIMSDADDDGIHIASLVMLFMFVRYPSLVARGFIYRWESPVVRLTKKKETLRFYRLAEYLQWKEEHPNDKSWTLKYIKGLTGNNRSDTHEDARIRKLTMELPDDETPAALRLAFDEALSNDRKRWMEQYVPRPIATPNGCQTITRFIAEDHILFAFTALTRAIPNFEDFLKESQRKLLHVLMLENSDTFIEVDRISARTADKTKYHFGAANLMKATIKMTQTFVGSNNLAFMEGDSNFGDREVGGKNCGNPRYIKVKMNWWIPLVFRKEDAPLLEFHKDEKEKDLEPITYRPILPVGLFNGFRGIAVGYSTFGPAYHPMAVCEAVLARIGGNSFPPLTPWYRGFTGALSLSKDGESFVSKGSITFDQRGVPHVTELPVGEWTKDYKVKVLDHLIEKTKELRRYEISTKMADEVGLRLEGLTIEPTLANLKLIKNTSLTNQTLLTPEGRPVNYRSSNNILDHWVPLRLKAYENRKAYQLNKWEKEIGELRLRERFLRAVAIDKILIIIDRPDAEVKAAMEALGLPEYLLDIKSRKLTKEGVAETVNNRISLEQKYSELYQRDVRDIWREEIREFMTEYRKHYSN
jgi:DNA topoisomerase-2